MKNAPAILTITDAEYHSVKQRLLETDPVEYIGSVSVERGIFAGYKVVLVKIPDMGSKDINSITTTLHDIISFLNPTCIIEVGICFGLKDDFHIGDVCICKLSIDYEFKKIEDGIHLNRPRLVNSSEPLLSRLSHHGRNHKTTFRVMAGVFASGDKVVNDATLKSEIKRAIPEAVVGDMESYVLGRICDARRIPWAVIKSSSDDGINKTDRSQSIAADNAAEFLMSFLQKNPTLPALFDETLEVNEQTDPNHFKNITYEIIGKSEFQIDPYDGARTAFYIHYHPDMGGAWVIVYLYRAHSIPEAIRQILKILKPAPHRVDLCIVSRGNVSEQRLTAYRDQLDNGGCKVIYVNTIKEFVFERVVKSKFQTSEIIHTRHYIDQKIYKNNSDPVSSKLFILSFLRPSTSSHFHLKPISVILGDGGIGKTTFCSSIAKSVHNSGSNREHLLLVTKSDVLRAYSGAPINTIIDLYREYRIGQGQQTRVIDDIGFELALSSGSIVMIVDGIDEIESACGGNFNMNGFIDSISTLNSRLQSCKVLLTSRAVGAERFSHAENIDVSHLKGFSDNDVNEYIQDQPHRIPERLRKIVSRIRGGNGFVNPYLLSVATQIFADDESDQEDDDETMLETTHLDISDPFQYILARVLAREIEKQSLGVSIDDYYELLHFVVVDQNNSVDYDGFELYVGTMLGPGSIATTSSLTASYLKCFLFARTGSTIQINHEQYVALIRTKSVVKLFTDGTKLKGDSVRRMCNILGADYNDSLGVKEACASALKMRGVTADEVNMTAACYLRELEKYLGSASVTLEKKTIFSLHSFALFYNGVKDGADAATVLKKLHAGCRIKNLFVYSDFPLIDFSELIIENSEFHNYRRFLLCKGNQKTSFRRCRVTNCSERYGKGNLTLEMFDKDCFLDEGVKLALQSSATKKGEVNARLRSDTKQVLKLMRQGLGFVAIGMNRIKQGTSLSSEKSYDELLTMMCNSGILTFDSVNQLYSVAKPIQRDAMAFCDEGIARASISRAIRTMSE